MKTLITGGTGFLGNHLLAELAATSAPGTLRVLVQSPPADLLRSGVEVVRGSVTNGEDVRRAVEGVERIYHLAGMVSRRSEDAPRMYEVHVTGTRLLCEAAAAAGVRRVLIASTSGTVAVSRSADDRPDEDAAAPVDLIGAWPYYASKLYQEEAARRACGDKVELVTVNPSLLLGPGDVRLSSTRDVLSFLSRDIPLVPGGGLNFVDVRDVAAVLPAAMDRGRAGERYLLGGTNWTFAEFFARLSRMTKVPGPRLRLPKGWPVVATRLQAALWNQLGRTVTNPPESLEMAECFWYFDSTKAQQELGFRTREAAETLFDTVTYLRREVLGLSALGAAKRA